MEPHGKNCSVTAHSFSLLLCNVFIRVCLGIQYNNMQ